MKDGTSHRWLRRTLASLCVILLIYYCYSNRVEFVEAFHRLDLSITFLSIGSIAAQIACRSWRDKRLYHSAGFSVPGLAIFNLQVKQNLMNYLPFKAGTLYAAIKLTRVYGLGWGHFTAMFAAQHTLTLGVTFLAAASSLLVVSQNHLGTAAAFMVVSALSATALLSGIPRTPRLRLPEKMQHFLQELHHGLAALAKDSRVLLSTSLLSLLGILLSAWRLQMLVSVGGVQIDYATGLVFAAGVYASFFFAVTPAGLGIREGILGAIAGMMSLPAGAAVIASTLDRILVLVFCGTIASIQAVASFRRTPPSITRDIDRL